MTVLRLDNYSIVVDDLPAAIAFFGELGLQLEGEATVGGPWVDRIIALEGVQVDIAMMRTPDGHGRVEVTKFKSPVAVNAGVSNAPVNALGFSRMMFAIDDIDDVVERLRAKHGAELVGEITQYEDQYRLCYMRAAQGFIIGLAQPLK